MDSQDAKKSVVDLQCWALNTRRRYLIKAGRAAAQTAPRFTFLHSHQQCSALYYHNTAISERVSVISNWKEVICAPKRVVKHTALFLLSSSASLGSFGLRQ